MKGAAIEAREDGAFVIGIDDVRIARIGNDVAAFAAADSVPIAGENRAVIAARADADGRVVLLRAVDAILKIVVGGDVIELRGGLVVLRGPVLAAVDTDGGAAVVAIDHAIGVVGIDPESVMIAVRRVDAFERFAAIVRTVQAGVGDVHAVDVFGIGPNVREIPGALREAVVVGDKRPVHAAVVAAIEAAFFGFDERVDDIRIGAGDRNG